MTNQNYNVNLACYNEAAALQQLLNATVDALDADAKALTQTMTTTTLTSLQ